jgi:hypothetical protein
VIAILVNVLLAQGAINLFFQQGNSQAVSYCSAKQARLENGVSAILLRGHGRDKPVGMGLRTAPKALSLAS